MKKINHLLLFMLLLTGLTGCKNKIKYDYDGKGVLVSSTLYEYGIKGNTTKTRTDTIYDENNKKLFVYYYRNNNTKPYGYITNIYNEKGKIIKSDYDSGGLVITIEYEYDNELLIKETSNGLYGKSITYTYDEKKNLITELEDSFNGLGHDFKTEYIYYDNNNIKYKTCYTSDDYEKNGWKTTGKYEYIYDDNNRVVNELYHIYDEESDSFTLTFKEEYSYDDNGNLLNEFRYRYLATNESWSNIHKSEYTYDKNNKIKYVYWQWNNETWEERIKADYKYDKNNNLILETNYSNTSGSFKMSKKEVIKYTYYK